MPEIMSQKEAKERGLKTYFTGRPCKRQHDAERRTYNGTCVQCEEEIGAKWRAENLEHHRESAKAYYWSNIEKVKERKAKKRQENRDHEVERFKAEERQRRKDTAPARRREKQRQYAAANREKRNADARRRHKENPQKARDKAARMKASDPGRQSRYDRVSYLRHSEKRKENTRRWRENNPDRAKQQYSDWLAANPEKAKAKVHRRRARLMGNGGSFTKDDIDRIYKLQKSRCAICGVLLKGKYQIDHIVPLADGGPNIARNIQLLCNVDGCGCNQKKGSKDPIDFARSLGKLL